MFYQFNYKKDGWKIDNTVGPVPINDMQSLPPSKVAKLGFCSKKLRNVGLISLSNGGPS